MKTIKPNESIGLHGCYCHPFASHELAIAAGNQKFKIGQIVRDRCTKEIGGIESFKSPGGFYDVKFGSKQSDIRLMHPQNLEKL